MLWKPGTGRSDRRRRYFGGASSAKLTFQGALEAETADVLDEVSGQLTRLDQLRERASRVERRDDHRGQELGAVGEGDAGRQTVPGDDVIDGGVEPDLRTQRLGGPREDLREAAVATLVERPCAHLAIMLTEDVVQQDEPRTLGIGPDLGADDARRGQVALQDVRHE